MVIRISSKEQEELITKNLRLVHHLVNKLGVDTSDYDEIVSIGTIGLVKAAATFDKSKGWKFATYASNCINNEIFMYFRKSNKYTNTISLDDSVATDKDGNEMLLVDMLDDPDSNFVEQIEERDILSKYINIILNLLKPKERLIMLYKMAGITQPCIAKILNLSQSYISRLKEKTKEKVKEHFTTLQYFKEVYTMSIVGDSYKISFSSKDVKNFNGIFAKFLQNLTTAETLPDFRVICNKERISIQVPAHPESFSFIAQIIQQIDDYSLTFISDTNTISNDNSALQKGKTDETKKSVEENEGYAAIINSKDDNNAEISEKTVSEDTKQIISDNLSTSVEVDKTSLTNVTSNPKRGDKQRIVIEYMLSQETFSLKELKEHFQNIKAGTIAFIVNDAKNKGLIISTGRGKYATKKD